MMSGTAGAPVARTPAEVKRLLDLDRAGLPYLVLRDGSDQQREIMLEEHPPTSIGRDESCDVPLPWDGTTSRLHAELVCRAGSWMVVDDGLSTNGTFVNGERIHGRRRLADGDMLRLGRTAIQFREPSRRALTSTSPVDDEIGVQGVTPMQRKVLVALCRPFADETRHAVPATNPQIAAELVLSDDAVKSHMRAIFHRLGVADLPQNAKRARVVEVALAAGIVTPRDLRESPPRQ